MCWDQKFGLARCFLYNFALSDNASPSQDFPMSDQSKVNSRRRGLVIASACAGGVSAVATAGPFAASMFASERAEAPGAPLAADIGPRHPWGKKNRQWGGPPGLD